MFTLIAREILLFESRSALSPAQRGTGSERVEVSVKILKNIRILLKLLEKWLTYKLKRFSMVFNFFRFCLTISVPQKLKTLIFEMPIFPQTLNINTLRTTSAKPISMHTIGKLIKYSLKNVSVKTMFTINSFRDITVQSQFGIINWERKG